MSAEPRTGSRVTDHAGLLQGGAPSNSKRPGGPRAVAQTIEVLDRCLAVRARLEPFVRRWLEAMPAEPAAAR